MGIGLEIGMNTKFVSVTCLLFLQLFCFSQDFIWTPKFKVRVDVAGPASTQSTVKGYLTRELRKIEDVIVSDSECHFAISCVLLETPTGAGIQRYSMSCVVTSKYQTAGIINLLSGCLDASNIEAVGTYLREDGGGVVKHQVLTGPISRMKETCEELITGLDGDEFQKTRSAFAEILKLNAKNKGGFNFLIGHPSVGIEWVKQSNLPAPKITVIQQQPAAPAVSKFTVVGIKEGDVLNLRTGPGMNFETALTIEGGVTGIVLVGKPVMNGATEWVQINVRDHIGWVRRKYLKMEAN
jgi:hypothetical protein